jgi:hypothetical protein
MEEHLLICPTCQDLLADVDEYIHIAKAALALSAPQHNGGKPLVTERPTRRRLSTPVMAAVTLAALLP